MATEITQLVTQTVVEPAEKRFEKESTPRDATADVGNAPKQNESSTDEQPIDLDENRSEEVRSKLEDTVTKINEYVQSIGRELQFEIDDESGRPIITVLDARTDQVIRRIPPEEFEMVAEYANGKSVNGTNFEGFIIKTQA